MGRQTTAIAVSLSTRKICFSESARRTSSYARREASGGPLENGRRKCGAMMAGEAYANDVGEASMTAGAKVARAAIIPTSVLPALQSPRQLHWLACVPSL